MNFLSTFLLVCLISTTLCVPIIELPAESVDNSIDDDDDDVQLLWCSGWRVAGEANNLSPWNKIPENCVDYVQDYMLSRSYEIDMDIVCDEAMEFAKSVVVGDDGLDVWVFDVDETLLSNLPYYGQHGYGSELFDNIQFDKWVLEGVAQAIKPSLKLYKEVQRLGFKIFLLTGRTENKREITINNLIMAGFENWDRLILRGEEDHGKTAVAFKSEKRKAIMDEGFRIIGNSGDQWSDLIGSHVSMRSFKLSNPMYFIS
ncbi:putative Acid phosphatase [Helianthus debilis subsp. tardiflorus]